jgi:hypothetical protein
MPPFRNKCTIIFGIFGLFRGHLKKRKLIPNDTSIGEGEQGYRRKNLVQTQETVTPGSSRSQTTLHCTLIALATRQIFHGFLPKSERIVCHLVTLFCRLSLLSQGNE